MLQHAKECPGFDEASIVKYPNKTIQVGFSRETIIQNAGKVLQNYFIVIVLCLRITRVYVIVIGIFKPFL